MKKIIAILALPVIMSACTKKADPSPAPVPTGNGTVKLEFMNVAGSSNLTLNSQWYINQHGDSFKVSKFNYYISNIKLNGADTTYTEAESYHLIQQSEPTSGSFDLPTVRSGQYSSITFTIGVDSLRNVSGAQTGALDPINGMFWSWSTGYIMQKLEGVSPKSTQSGGLLTFHLGGFTGANSVLRTVTLNFPQPLQLAVNGESHVHISADVLALFKSPNLVDFAVLNSLQMPGTAAKNIADNSANMFTVTYAGL